MLGENISLITTDHSHFISEMKLLKAQQVIMLLLLVSTMLEMIKTAVEKCNQNKGNVSSVESLRQVRTAKLPFKFMENRTAV